MFAVWSASKLKFMRAASARLKVPTDVRLGKLMSEKPVKSPVVGSFGPSNQSNDETETISSYVNCTLEMSVVAFMFREPSTDTRAVFPVIVPESVTRNTSPSEPTSSKPFPSGAEHSLAAGPTAADPRKRLHWVCALAFGDTKRTARTTVNAFLAHLRQALAETMALGRSSA